ncbi:MAG: hypothetical protein WBG11_08850 [Methylocella sp.]
MTVIQQDRFSASFNMGSASSPAFVLEQPGMYRLIIVAAGGSGSGPFTGAGSIELCILAPDGATYAPLANANFNAVPVVYNQSQVVALCAGTYQFVVTGTVSGAYASIAPAQSSTL